MPSRTTSSSAAAAALVSSVGVVSGAVDAVGVSVLSLVRMVAFAEQNWG
ncbi:hypothetical protein JOF54_000697 [Microlunatus capsulatus]|uniref:Uncharacterized protein n=1 Tax=Microlunatus capsulatus TaxID=99117 RepID=A0ABS4Z4W0_9ACTN|nr:hypothetical protein [Microlunatus capsulatus]MBP2415775.1 hypothetical protein [Microlunatus capsulatus]